MLPKTIDVAIGIVFLYLLLTFAASVFAEFISTIRNWRAQILYESIQRMLKSGNLNVQDLYTNPLIIGLGQDEKNLPLWGILEKLGWHPPGGDGGPAPSYLPAAVFSAVVLEQIMAARITNEDKPQTEMSPEKAIAEVRTWAAGDSSCALKSVLNISLATQGASIQAVRLAIEKWFNDTMDRSSGWYKRRTQSILLVIGIGVAFGGNVDTIAVARWLWQGDAARGAVVSAATDYVKQHPPTLDAKAAGLPKNQTPPDLKASVTQIVAADQLLTSLQYPIGFSQDRLRQFSLVQYLLGGLLTAIAISMGSTFWFDALQNLIKIRATGPKPSR
jgi:hypothetical protein